MPPTPWTVDVLHYGISGQDAYGNDVEGYSAPDTQEVYGWAPSGTDETGGWRRTVVADLQLYAPRGFRCGPHDQVVVDGVTYDVQGEVEDYTHGPFGHQPGVRVNLTRTAG